MARQSSKKGKGGTRSRGSDLGGFAEEQAMKLIADVGQLPTYCTFDPLGGGRVRMTCVFDTTAQKEPAKVAKTKAAQKAKAASLAGVDEDESKPGDDVDDDDDAKDLDDAKDGDDDEDEDDRDDDK